MPIDSTAILLWLLSMLGFAFSTAFIKPASEKFWPNKTVIYQKFLTTIFFLLSLLFFLNTTTFDRKYIGIAFLIAFLGYIPFASFIKGITIWKIGLISPISNSSVIFTVFFSLLFFNEQLSSRQLISIAWILLGIIISSINFQDFQASEIFKKSSGIIYALIACIGRGLVFALFHIPVNHLWPILTGVIIEWGIFLLSSLLHRKLLTKQSIQQDYKSKNIKWILFSALALTIGSIFYFIGIKTYSSSIIYAITSINPAIILLYGKFVYKENLTLQQYIGIAIMISGIIALSIV